MPTPQLNILLIQKGALLYTPPLYSNSVQGVSYRTTNQAFISWKEY